VGLYWRIENRLREADSAIWPVVGGIGEVVAVRRDRFPARPGITAGGNRRPWHAWGAT
jgi:hypothetical protein